MLTLDIVEEIESSGWETSIGLPVTKLVAVIPRIANSKMQAFIVIVIS
jgi:hypothetical protein